MSVNLCACNGVWCVYVKCVCVCWVGVDKHSQPRVYAQAEFHALLDNFDLCILLLVFRSVLLLLEHQLNWSWMRSAIPVWIERPMHHNEPSLRHPSPFHSVYVFLYISISLFFFIYLSFYLSFFRISFISSGGSETDCRQQMHSQINTVFCHKMATNLSLYVYAISISYTCLHVNTPAMRWNWVTSLIYDSLRMFSIHAAASITGSHPFRF